MRNFKLDIAIVAHEVLKEEFENCKLRFQCLEASMEDLEGENGLRIIDTMSPFSKNIKVLELSFVHFSSEGMFFKFLSSFEQLEKLLLSNVIYSEDEGDGIVDAPVPNLKLKNLALISTGKAIVESLSKAKVQSPRILFSCTHHKFAANSDFSYIINLLNSQENLVELGIKTHELEQQREVYQQFNVKFVAPKSLRTLSVVFGADPDNDLEQPSTKKHFEHFARFISKQKPIVELEIISKSLRIPQKVFTTIQKSLALKSLTLDVTNLPKSFENMDSYVFTANDRLKIFKVLTELPNKFASTFFRMFNAIEDLSFTEDENENLKHASDHLKQLKRLRIHSIQHSAPQVSIPTLRTFRVDQIESNSGLQTILDANPSITSLALNWDENIFDSKSVPSLSSKLVNLEILTMAGRSLKQTREMFDSLSTNCPKLLKIEIFSPESTVDDIVLEHEKFKICTRLVSHSGARAHPLYNNGESIWHNDRDFLTAFYWETEEDDAEAFDFYDDPNEIDYEDYGNFGFNGYDSDDSEIGWQGNGNNYFRNYDDWINRQEDWDWDDWLDFKEMYMDSD